MIYTGTAILGSAFAGVAQLEAQAKRINPDIPDVAALYLRLAPKLGVRGDLAYAQALLETNYFRYGGLVKASQNNFAGIGATGPNQPGASFATPEEGVLAHLQHLYAYASTVPLPEGMPLVDPRFDRVERGSAPNVGALSNRWASDPEYGRKIDRILGEILMEPAPGDAYQVTEAYMDPDSQNRPGACTTSGCWQGLRGVVVHRTASPSMNARAIRNYFNTAPDGRFASSQFTVDDKVILQLMPIGEVAYHTIGANFDHVGIETCEYNWGTDTWPETYKRLVWLTAYLVRAFKLTIDDVSGHNKWDPVNRPYDPTHPGWTPAEGKATGLFEWDQFIADVKEQIDNAPPRDEPAPADGQTSSGTAQPPEPPPSQAPAYPVIAIYVSQGGDTHCTDGLLIDSTTYVPIRPYTSCLLPEAQVLWVDGESKVVVQLPDAVVATPRGAADGGTAQDEEAPQTGVFGSILRKVLRLVTRSGRPPES